MLAACEAPCAGSAGPCILGIRDVPGRLPDCFLTHCSRQVFLVTLFAGAQSQQLALQPGDQAAASDQLPCNARRGAVHRPHQEVWA